ncbi:Fe-S cluster assembly protein SufB [Candidatus Peregrinibacteria bacterium]|nr:Fe-S cluster assembly protein SufB [Candidatus Peregrinibacteria bacterium]
MPKESTKKSGALAVKLSNQLSDYKYGFTTKDKPKFRTEAGLSEEVVRSISGQKNEPQWMLEKRLEALAIFNSKIMPTFGADLSGIEFEKIHYYLKPSDQEKRSWEEVPEEIKKTFDRLGIPEAERKYLAGVGAQFESEMVYHNLHETLAKKGVIFEGTDAALQKYPEIFEEYFGTVIPARDNKFAALNTAVWSGGSFIYIPKGVHVELPLQAYFRINAEFMGQFERTLIIADEGSSVHYVEGCTAPTYSSNSLHSAVVEIICKKGARVQYSTIQNWSNNVYNLVTKRARCEEEATMFWLDCNLGSKVTMKYPAVYLMGRGSKAEILSVAMAGAGQVLDAGAKVIHAAPDTSSTITSNSLSRDGGRSSYRGLVQVLPGATGVKSRTVCDALLLDDISRSDTYPTMDIAEADSAIAHEATVTKISEDQLFYLMSRGFSEAEAAAMIVNGFIDPIVKILPMEYALEMNRLVEMEMEGSVG